MHSLVLVHVKIISSIINIPNDTQKRKHLCKIETVSFFLDTPQITHVDWRKKYCYFAKKPCNALRFKILCSSNCPLVEINCILLCIVCIYNGFYIGDSGDFVYVQ
jgi:hypothetical protein